MLFRRDSTSRNDIRSVGLTIEAEIRPDAGGGLNDYIPVPFAYIEIAAARGAAHEMSGVVCRLASSATVWQNRHWALLIGHSRHRGLVPGANYSGDEVLPHDADKSQAAVFKLNILHPALLTIQEAGECPLFRKGMFSEQARRPFGVVDKSALLLVAFAGFIEHSRSGIRSPQG